jgi:hypothetical protein
MFKNIGMRLEELHDHKLKAIKTKVWQPADQGKHGKRWYSKNKSVGYEWPQKSFSGKAVSHDSHILK